MEGIPIYYVMQPSIDDSLNVFFLPPAYRNLSEIKIKDVVVHFPLKDNNNNKYFHYRFYAVCDKDQKTWVDISNMNAKAPVVDNKILLKVLELSEPHHTKIFNTLANKPAPTSSVPGNSARADSKERPAPQSKPQSQAPPQTQQQYNNQGQRPNFGSPSHEDRTPKPSNNLPRTPPPKQTQAPPTNAFRSPPAASASHYEDLLGGDHSDTKGSSNNVTNVTFTAKTTVTTSSASKTDSAVLNMSRSELVQREKQMIDEAINDKLKFAQQVWDEEAKGKQEKEKAYDELEDLIKKWSGKNNQRNNIRALLCTIQEVAWQGSGWATVSLSDLMDPKRIKVNYFKAMTKFHPDKNSGGDYRQRYICERVTNELNAAWDEFRKANPGI